MGKRVIDYKKTAKRYAPRVLVDTKDDLLFGEDLLQYVIASANHDTGKKYHNYDFYYALEEAVLDLYDKYVYQCPCCKKYLHKEFMIKHNKQRFCKNCFKVRLGKR